MEKENDFCNKKHKMNGDDDSSIQIISDNLDDISINSLNMSKQDFFQNNSQYIHLFDTYSDILEIINYETYKCLVCKQNYKFSVKQGTRTIINHLNSSKHISRFNLSKETISVSKIDQETFNEELIIWLVENNIPLRKIEEQKFKGFIEKYTSRKLLSRTQYSKNLLPEIYEKKYNEILKYYAKKNFYLMFDESPDINGRKILNIIIGELLEIDTGRVDILKTIELEVVNSEVIRDVINFEVNKIVHEFQDYKNFKLLISDGASYCIKAGQLLKLIFPSLLHITCLAHAVHNLSETIRNEAPLTNKLIGYLKRYFKFNTKNKRNFQTLSGITLPPFPVITRWGTWFKFLGWLYVNFNAVERFIEKLKGKNSIERKLKKIIKQKEIDDEIISSNKNIFIAEIIKKMEKRKITVQEMNSLVNSITSNLEDEKFKKRWEDILKRNPDYLFFKNYNLLRCPVSERIFNYAPLSSAEVERSFSAMKRICDDRRTRMSVEMLGGLLSIYFKNKE